MLDLNFINQKLSVSPTAIQENFKISTKDLEKLKRYKDIYCPTQDNHHKDLLSFIQAARASYISQNHTLDFIFSNIEMSPQSGTKEQHQIVKLVQYLYGKYGLGNYDNTSDASQSKPNYTTHTTNANSSINSEDYEVYRITSKSNFPTPKSILTINGANIGGEASLVAVSGKQKSGKSSLCNIMLSGCFSEELDGVPDGFKMLPSPGTAVLHFDTEQASHKQLNNLRYHILRRGGTEVSPDYYYSYNTRRLSIPQTLDLIDQTFEIAAKKHNGIHFALIDGVADLVRSVNNEEDCISLVKHLLHLAEKYQTLVVAVIHRNPNDGKVRGHLGSELLRKCDSVLAVKKDGDDIYIEPEELRNASKEDIPKYLFRYDKDKGYHCYTGSELSEQKSGRYEELVETINNTLHEGEKYERSELIDIITTTLEIGEPMAQKYIQRLAKDEIIGSTERGVWEKVPPPFASSGENGGS